LVGKWWFVCDICKENGISKEKIGKGIWYVILSFCSLPYTIFLWSCFLNYPYEYSYNNVRLCVYICQIFNKISNCVILIFSFKYFYFIKSLLSLRESFDSHQFQSNLKLSFISQINGKFFRDYRSSFRY
jgi:hypothetical protein